MLSQHTAPDIKAPACRVAHLTSNHQPFDTRIFLKQCRTLATAGYKVYLVVPHSESLTRDGVQIEAVPVPNSRRERMLRTTRLVLKQARLLDADVYHIHDSELIPAGWILKLSGKQVIFDAHENRPKQILSKDWIPTILRPLVAGVTRIIERLSGSVFDLIIAATPSIATTFPRNRTVLVQNYPIQDELVSAATIAFAERREDICFVGGITDIRGAREMVQAIGLLSSKPNSRLKLAGLISPPGYEAQLKQLEGWSRVDWLGQLQREEVRNLLAECRAGLILYQPEPNHTDAQPNKLFEYMSAGLPVIASDFPLWRNIIEAADCGVVVDPTDPEAISDAMEQLLSDPLRSQAMAENGKKAVQNIYNWGAEAVTLLAAYRTLDSKQRRSQDSS